MDKVVHFEIPADNLDRAKKFYQTTFGWQIEDYPDMKYVIARTAEVDENRMLKEPGAINGGMMERAGAVPKAPSFAIDVENLEAAIQKVKDAGGTVITDKMEVGDMGWMAYFKDTEGNIMSLWQTKKPS
jgi:predicted enzyme related to lactoylglutathione lyase